MVEIGTRNIKGCKPSTRFQKYFQKTNILYFENSLPATRVLVAPLLKITRLPQKELSKSSSWVDAGEYGLAGYDEYGDPVIILDKGMCVFHSILAKQTVLHEQIHFYIGLDRPGHGIRFKTQVRRIASLGALDNLI
jgi:hypothetical protein